MPILSPLDWIAVADFSLLVGIAGYGAWKRIHSPRDATEPQPLSGGKKNGA